MIYWEYTMAFLTICDHCLIIQHFCPLFPVILLWALKNKEINHKGLHLLVKTPSKALEILYGDKTMSSTRVFGLYKSSKSCREKKKHDSRSRKPSTSRTEVSIERVRQMACRNRRLIVWMVPNQLDSNWKNIKEDLGMQIICEKIMLTSLNDASYAGVSGHHQVS